MIIIGITGTLGSGKGTVVEYLKEKYDFKHYSASAFISEEIARRGMEKTRENMRIVANELRTTHEPSYVLSELYKQATEDFKNSETQRAVLESIRSPREVEFLQAQNQPFYLLAVDADPRVRFDRIVLRGSSKDSVTFEKFLDDEQQEMNDTNPAGMKIAECIKLADKVIYNDGDVEQLQNQVDEIVRNLIKE